MPAQGSNLRRGRFSEPGRIYLITTVTRERQPLFADWRIGRQLVKILRASDQAGMSTTLAFVIMPDHLHWLFTLGEASDLSAVMKHVKGQSSRLISPLFGLNGIWQNGFHDHAARADEDIQDMARYVVANPLRAGLVQKLGDYPLWDAIYL
ncbi:REP-associated tyrosine transposase [Undibacterium pigrum]|uniref:REP element-mobilizing transposase RayT n=1 Tax=Undibacterium pigrum TaxID=401470 RepID=A0A318J5Z5_9BURK|nr:transposase [Undibacterium pigrum]PXX42572.1 REP element-mobilizing transposase RayT [Undibacterium pigrum]